jgi:hypothetical protein
MWFRSGNLASSASTISIMNLGKHLQANVINITNFSVLAESLNQIKYELMPSNVSVFQGNIILSVLKRHRILDFVEVHLRQIFFMMKGKHL